MILFNSPLHFDSRFQTPILTLTIRFRAKSDEACSSNIIHHVAKLGRLPLTYYFVYVLP